VRTDKLSPQTVVARSKLTVVLEIIMMDITFVLRAKLIANLVNSLQATV